MATYQGEAFLREQLESIKRQSVLPTEVVISDDNSTDRTLEIVAEVFDDSWCRSHGVSLVIRRNEQALGPGKNFEQAILACTGEFVALCDQDDVWPENKIERLLGVFQENPHTLLIHTDARLVDKAGRPLGMTLTEGISLSEWERATLLSGHSLPAIIRRNLATGATVMIRRELADRAFPLPDQAIHDSWLALAASMADGLVFLPEELLDYRQHDSNQIGGRPMGALDSLVAVLKSWKDMTAVLAQRNADIQALIERLGDAVSEENRAIVHARIRHNQWRIGLPSSRLFRVWPVLLGVLKGRYRDFGRQPHDVIRDLVMPPREVLLSLYRVVARKSGN